MSEGLMCSLLIFKITIKNFNHDLKEIETLNVFEHNAFINRRQSKMPGWDNDAPIERLAYTGTAKHDRNGNRTGLTC